MTAGFWHTNFWPTDFWHEDFWSDYAEVTVWVSPTSHSDVNNKWSDEVNAYDDDTSTFAFADSDSTITDYLGLGLTSPIRSSKIRFMAKVKTNNINIDVFYDGGWHDVYEGTDFTDLEWVEKEYPEGIKVIVAARVSINVVVTKLAKRLIEFDFGKLPMGLKSVERGIMRGVMRGAA